MFYFITFLYINYYICLLNECANNLIDKKIMTFEFTKWIKEKWLVKFCK